MDVKVAEGGWHNAIVRKLVIAMLVLVAACGGSSTEGTVADGDLPVFDAGAFEQRLDQSTRPTVINVWASWCLPCRSEAPLLTAAHERYGDRVDFVGIDIQDTQTGAAQFLAEYGITYENQFDLNAEIRGLMGGSGVPITYFVAPGGALVDTHFGIIDEAQLALGIDELIASSAS